MSKTRENPEVIFSSRESDESAIIQNMRDKVKKSDDGVRNLDDVDLYEAFLGEEAPLEYRVEERKAIKEKHEMSKKEPEPIIVPPSLKKLTQDDLFTVDLHGKYKKEALSIVRSRIAGARGKKEKRMIIVTGKGYNSENGSAVLKPAIEKLLTEMKRKGQIENFKTAPGHLGGGGAFVVELK